jgi:hypothetical protein
MNEYLQSADIFKMLARYSKPLIIVGIVSLVASAIFSGPAFIKPKYKSFAILYPTNLIAYSQESATEQLVQLLQSADIRDQLISTFNLSQHYEIDTVHNPFHRSDVVKLFEQNVSVNKTEYESAEITIYDTDPVVAAAMVDSMIHFMNLKARALQRSKTTELVIVAKRRMLMKKAEMDSVENLVREYRVKYGLLDYKSQAREYSKALAKATTKGSSKGISEAKQLLNILAEKGGDFNTWNELLWKIRGGYSDLKTDYENLYKDATKELTYENMVTHPSPSDKKAYPIRWLIVLVAVAASVFLSFLVMLFMEVKQVKVESPASKYQVADNKTSATAKEKERAS